VCANPGVYIMVVGSDSICLPRLFGMTGESAQAGAPFSAVRFERACRLEQWKTLVRASVGKIPVIAMRLAQKPGRSSDDSH